MQNEPKKDGGSEERAVDRAKFVKPMAVIDGSSVKAVDDNVEDASDSAAMAVIDGSSVKEVDENTGKQPIFVKIMVDVPPEKPNDDEKSDLEILRRGLLSQALFMDEEEVANEEPPTNNLDDTVEEETNMERTTVLTEGGVVEEEIELTAHEEIARKFEEEHAEWLRERKFDFHEEEDGETRAPAKKKEKKIRANRKKEDNKQPEIDQEAMAAEEKRMSKRILEESMRITEEATRNEPPPKKQKRRSSKIVADDEVEDKIRKKREEVESLKNNIKNAAIYLECRAEILLSLTSGKGARDSLEVSNSEMLLDRQLKFAQQRVDEAKERERSRPGMKKEKFHADEKKFQEDLLKAKQRSMENVVQSLRFINVHNCEFSNLSRKPDTLAILEIQAAVLDKKVPITELVVEAARVGEKIIVVDGVNRIMAFRGLSKMLHEKHGDEYESGEEATVRYAQSQMEGAACTSSASTRASQPTSRSKLKNPYCMILADVVESAPPELGGTVFGALHKANQKPRSTPVGALELAIRRRTLARPFQLDSANGRTVEQHLEKLRASGIRCNSKEIIFLRTLDEDIEHLLKDTLEANPHEKLHHIDFLRKFTHARKVCKHTADRVIRHLADGKISADSALQMIADHSSKPYYVLSGRNCPSDPAEVIQNRLEGGMRTYRCINYHVQNHRKLDHAAMLAREYDPERILKEIERIRYPYALGFVKPTIVEIEDVYEERCLLHFIDIEDFNANYGNTFMKSIGGATEAIYFIVHQDPETAGGIPVANVNEVVRAGNLPMTITIQRITRDDTNNKNLKQSHSHNVLMVAGSRQNAWRHQQLERFLTGYQISNTLNNEQLRRIMYQSKRHNEETTDINKYNMVYVHSGTPVVVDIVADMALNRVATSLTGSKLEAFKNDLERAQKARTMYGNTIEDPPKELSSEDDDEGEPGQKKKKPGKRPNPDIRD